MKINYTVRGVIGIAVAGALAAGAGGIAVGAVGAAPAAAPRAAVEPLAGALGFNVVVERDARVTSNENEATLAIGGDLVIGGTYNVGNEGRGGHTFTGDAEPTGLLVGGAVDFDHSLQSGVVRVLDNMYVKVGAVSSADVLISDANNARVDTRVVDEGDGYDGTPHVELTTRQPVDSVSRATGLDFTALFAGFRAKSDELAACENTVVLRDSSGTPLPDQSDVPDGSDVRIELAENTTNVLDITAENLSHIANIVYDPAPSADTPLLVNVDTSGVEDEFIWSVGTDNISNTSAPYVLWNFPTATSITMPQGGDSLEGTLYAPRAHLTDLDSSNIEGDIVVAELTHGSAIANGGEFHYAPLAATFDCGSITPPTDDPTEEPTDRPAGGSGGGLMVEKRADRTHADVGDLIDFTITATNVTDRTRQETLTDDLTDLLRSATVVGTPTASLPALTYDPPLLAWNGELDPGESVTINYTVRTSKEGEIRNVVTWPGGSDCLEVWVWDRDRPGPDPTGGPCYAHGKPPKKPGHWHPSDPSQ
ncbi:collagen-binding domain-containing protein [Actinocorallia aurea]